MTARMKSPASYFPQAMEMLPALAQVPRGKGVDDETLELVHLRVSQINGCAWCLDFGHRAAQKAGFDGTRLALLPAWREATCYTDQQRAALALAETMTRLADHPDAVTDDVWAEAERQFDEQALAALVLWIATTTLFNLMNVTTRRVPGTWS